MEVIEEKIEGIEFTDEDAQITRTILEQMKLKPGGKLAGTLEKLKPHTEYIELTQEEKNDVLLMEEKCREAVKNRKLKLTFPS